MEIKEVLEILRSFEKTNFEDMLETPKSSNRTQIEASGQTNPQAKRPPSARKEQEKLENQFLNKGYKSLQKNLPDLNSGQFKSVVTLAVRDGYSDHVFINKLNKKFFKLQNSQENRELKSARFILKMIDLNTLAKQLKAHRIKQVTSLFERLLSKNSKHIANLSLKDKVSKALIGIREYLILVLLLCFLRFSKIFYCCMMEFLRES